MNDIVTINNNDQEEVVNLGGDNASSQISFQLAQDFYNEITGKSENLKEFSRDSFILKLHHIEQLHHLLEQSTEQYNVVSFIETYSVNYVNDCSERFSSLAKLKLQVGARGAAIEDISVQYKLLIVLPKTQRPQEYKIHINLISRVAKMENMRSELNGMPFAVPLFQFETRKVAVFSIDYVDISVANALMSVIKGWFNSVEKNEISKVTKLIRSYSHFLPRLFKYGLLGLANYYVYKASQVFVPATADINAAVVFILMSLLTLFVTFQLGSYLGKKAERNLDSIYEQSYINFSGADENFVNISTTKIKNSRNRVLASLIGTLILGAGGSLLAYLITG
ncbi:hypothetical protein Q4506_17075 [Colwellia sp. 4_MG-2023]|uniref:hypothetical protein n=1 Tax=unclassified Colwellia TaxID=196834 RepID=UPI0026E1FB36|nr:MULTISPECIES: hypothetical protein [unclassified Colwellia]MDO6508715.1 hypothetical protein [Colwellia sp. 5_MG-2023]MDO6557391.1 hypothetical protein [Colwellia sp. 4_MG-2023]